MLPASRPIANARLELLSRAGPVLQTSTENHASTDRANLAERDARPGGTRYLKTCALRPQPGLEEVHQRGCRIGKRFHSVSPSTSDRSFELCVAR